MKVFLPTPPQQLRRWEEGIPLPPTLPAAEKRTLPAQRSRPSGVGRAARPDPRRQGFLLVVLILLCLGSYYVVSHHIFTSVIVQGRSMLPTLQEGDRLILDRWTFHFRSPQRCDLVVLQDPGHKDYAVKRIIAMSGDTILLKQGAVYLNGRQLVETYVSPGTRTFSADARDNLILLGRDQYFVLGDNRENSEDSRFYGAVSRDRIIGLISK